MIKRTTVREAVASRHHEGLNKDTRWNSLVHHITMVSSFIREGGPKSGPTIPIIGVRDRLENYNCQA